MDEDQDLLKRMDGLEESMKLIMIALNIGGADNWRSRNENPVKNNTPTKPHNECM